MNFSEIKDQLDRMVKEQKFGMVFYLPPSAVDVKDAPILYMKENRCNYYNRANGYSPQEVEEARKNVKSKMSKAFLDGRGEWIDADPLKIGYVRETGLYYIIDAQNRLAAILAFNEYAKNNNEETPFEVIPCAVFYYETYQDALHAMYMLNGNGEKGSANQGWSVRNKRRSIAVGQEVNGGGPLSELWKMQEELQKSYPDYLANRAGEVVVYGRNEISNPRANEINKYSRITDILIKNIFPKEIIQIAGDTVTDTRKKQRIAKSFDLIMAIDELAEALIRFKENSPNHYVATMDESTFAGIGQKLQRHWFGQEGFGNIAIMVAKQRKATIYTNLVNYVGKNCKDLISQSRRFIDFALDKNIWRIDTSPEETTQEPKRKRKVNSIQTALQFD